MQILILLIFSRSGIKGEISRWDGTHSYDGLHVDSVREERKIPVIGKLFPFGGKDRRKESGFERMQDFETDLTKKLALWPKNAEGKVIIPFAFHRQFSARRKVETILARMNSDFTCVEFVKVKANELRRTQFRNGIFIMNGKQLEKQCWSTVGIAEGFTGRDQKSDS